MAKEKIVEKTIVFADRVKIRATSKAKHMIADREYDVHPELAVKLIKSGSAEEVK